MTVTPVRGIALGTCVFDAVRDYLINNFGAATKVESLLDYFNNDERVSIKRETLNRYVQIPVDLKISLLLPEI